MLIQTQFSCAHSQNLKRNLNQFKEVKMNEWKKVSEELPPLDTPVWAGWFEYDYGFTSGLFVFADDGIDILWCRCDETISYKIGRAHV